MYAKVPKLGRGRPGKLRKRSWFISLKCMRERISELFTNRYLFVQHGLSKAEYQKIAKLSRGCRDLKVLRELMGEVYRLFDRRCRTDTALEKLAKLRSKLSRFKHLGKVFSKLHSPNLEKALTFLDDKMLEATSNSVERANRRYRKMQKSIYRVQTKTTISHRIALDMLRDRDIEQRPIVLNALREARYANRIKVSNNQSKLVINNDDLQKSLVCLKLIFISHRSGNGSDSFTYNDLPKCFTIHSTRPPLLQKCKRSHD